MFDKEHISLEVDSWTFIAMHLGILTARTPHEGHPMIAEPIRRMQKRERAR